MMSLTSIPFSFKEVFTTHVATLHVNPQWSVEQFMQSVLPILETEFDSTELEIVECGQDGPGIPAEAGLPLLPSNISLRNKWGNQLYVAFYVRRRNHVYPQLENLNNYAHNIQYLDINPIIANSFVTSECPICFETAPTLTVYQCRHSICSQCHHQCIQTNRFTCPMCRSP